MQSMSLSSPPPHTHTHTHTITHPPFPHSVCCSECAPYYRTVLVLVPGTATAVAVAALALLTLWILLSQTRKTKHLKQDTIPGKASHPDQVESLMFLFQWHTMATLQQVLSTRILDRLHQCVPLLWMVMRRTHCSHIPTLKLNNHDFNHDFTGLLFLLHLLYHWYSLPCSLEIRYSVTNKTNAF